MSDKAIWWEKTVEYEYILNHLAPEQFAIPFDGEPEKLGDALFGQKNKFMLIEFKKERSKDCINAERKKFGDSIEDIETNLKSLHENLQRRSNHHFIVYGSCSGSTSKMEVEAANYYQFLNEESEFKVKLNTMKRVMTTRVPFEYYLLVFYWHKKNWKLEVKEEDESSEEGTQDEGIFSSFLKNLKSINSLFDDEKAFVAVSDEKSTSIIPVTNFIEYLLASLKIENAKLQDFENNYKKIVSKILDNKSESKYELYKDLNDFS